MTRFKKILLGFIGAGALFAIASIVNATTPNFWLLSNNFIKPLTSTWNLQVGSHSSNPTEADGGIYYNSSSKIMFCGINGVWQNCAVSSSTGISSLTAGANIVITGTSTIALNTFTYTVGTSGSDFNGSTDSAIQSALSAASTTGGTIYVKKGTYNFASNINIYNNETLQCDNGATFNVTTTTSQSIYFNGVSNASLIGCHVHDITPDSLSFGITSYREVEVHNSSNITLSKNTIDNSSGYGVYITSGSAATTSNVTLLNNYIQNNGHQDAIGGGVFNQGNGTTSNVSILGNQIINKVGNGTIGSNVDPNCFDMVAVDGMAFSGNNCQGMVLFGTEKVPNVNSQITDNIIRPNSGATSTSADVLIEQKTGIAGIVPGQILVSGNNIAGGGMRAEGSPTTSIDTLLISNNVIKNAPATAQGADAIPSTDGMYFDYVNNSLVTGNTVESSAAGVASSLGIKFTANTGSSTVSDNIIKDFASGVDFSSIATNKSQFNSFLNDTTNYVNVTAASELTSAGHFLIGTADYGYQLNELTSNPSVAYFGTSGHNNASWVLDTNGGPGWNTAQIVFQDAGANIWTIKGHDNNENFIIASSSGVSSFTIAPNGNLTLATTTISQLTLGNGIATGCLTNTSGLISSTGVACGSGGGGVATTSPFTAGYVPYATSTLALTNSNIYNTASGNVGIGTSTPDEKLQIAGDIHFTNTRTRTMSRTIPTTVGDEVDIGSFTLTQGAANFEIWITIASVNYSQNKRYFIPASYNGSTTWKKVLAAATTGAYGANDTDLEINSTALVTSFRLRRVSGTIAGTALITIIQQGVDTDTFVASTATSTVSAPTANYEISPDLTFTNRLQILSAPVNSGSYSLTNWNGTGNAVSAFIKTATNNGGSTPSAPQPALVLGREGISGQAYANFVEFNISRYENVSTNARTRMDIALTNGNGVAAGTNVMTLLSNGNVGIGTTSPAYTLDVYGSGTTSPFNVSSSSNVSLFNIAGNGSTTLSTLVTAGISVIQANSNGQLFPDTLPGGTNCLDEVGGIIGVTGSGNCATLGGNNAFTGLNSFSATTTLATTSIANLLLPSITSSVLSTNASGYVVATSSPTFTNLILTGTLGVTGQTTLATTTIAGINTVGYFDKSFSLASTTPDYLGNAFTSATFTIPSIWNPVSTTTMTNLFCETDVGTLLLNFGGTLLTCSTTGASSTPGTVFGTRKDIKVQVGTEATSPNNVNVTATFHF